MLQLSRWKIVSRVTVALIISAVATAAVCRADRAIVIDLLRESDEALAAARLDTLVAQIEMDARGLAGAREPTIAAAMEDQRNAAETMIGLVTDVDAATHALTERFGDIAHVAALTHGSAIQVIWAADDLATPAGTLIEELDGFLTTLRAG